jgi:hypothetical protein
MKRPKINLSKLPDLRDIQRAGEMWERVKGRAREGVEAATATEYRTDLNMPVRQIHGHIYTTADETRGVYTLADTNHANQAGGVQARVVDLAASAWEALAGRHVKIHIGNQPLNPWEWAQRTAAVAPRPAGEQGQLLVNHLCAASERQLDIGLIAGIVTVDVHLTGAKDGAPGDGWEEQDHEVLAHLVNDGLCGAPAPPGTIDWRIHSSLAPGHPVPVPVEGVELAPDDTDVFTEEVDWSASAMARSVRIRTYRGVETSEPVETWAAALTMSTIARRPSVGPLPPWMSACMHAPFPVQFVAAGKIIHPRDAAPMFAKRAEWQNDQIEHHENDHHMRAPDSVYETYEEARSLADDFANGEAEAMVSFTARLVVEGATHREVMDRVRWLKSFYRDNVRIALLLAKDQVTAISELCPGVREITRGPRRNAPVSMWADGVPNSTGAIGQDTGMWFGYTSAPLPRRAVYFDPWYPAEKLHRAPIYPVLGDPGAGRSTLGLRIIQECILTGDYVVAIDPAGEWATAAQLYGAPGRVRVLDLSAETLEVAGLLSIPRIIPNPDPAGFTDQATYDAAVQQAQANRVALAQDALRQLVDDDTWSDPLRRNALKDAAGECDGDLWAAIDWLTRSGNDEYVRLARELTAAAYGPARLLFPHRRADGTIVEVEHDDLLGSQVVVLTMQGMQFPAPGSSRKHWDSGERASALAMRLAAFLARRLIEIRPRRERKALIVDEASWLANWEHGAAWIASFVRHVRRWNTALFLMTQHPNDLKLLDPEGNTFACGGFVGCTEQVEVAEMSLGIVRAAPGLGAICPNLSWVKTREGRVKLPGEFLWVDPEGRVLRVRLDIDGFPILKAVANTTPGTEEGEQPQLPAGTGHVVTIRKPPEEILPGLDIDTEEPPDAVAV